MGRMFNNTYEIINKFVSSEDTKKTDYLKRENSNFFYSLALLRKNLSNYGEEEYLMSEIFSKELVNMYKKGIVYIHDKQLCSYCQSISCSDIAAKGVPTLALNMIPSAPTKKPDPAPRVIQPRNVRYNVEVGRYLRRFEHYLYRGIDEIWNGPWLS